MKVTIDLSSLEGFADRLNEIADELPFALARACNRAGDSMRTAFTRQLAEESGLLNREVKEHITVERATAESLEYTMTLTHFQTMVRDFGAHQTREGVRARPWGVSRVFPGTFMARDGVYKRTTPQRYPIVPLYGPELVAQAYRGDAIPASKAAAERTLLARLQHEIGRIAPKGAVVVSGIDDEGEGADED